VLFALAGWQHARHLTRKYGRRPFGWPEWVWGVVTGAALLIGLVLLAIAERGLRKAPPAKPGGAVQPSHGWSGNVAPAQAAMGYFPSGGTMANMSPTAVAERANVSAPAWAADPHGRHQYRWWDGSAWTAFVHDNGVSGTDQP